MVTKQVDKFEDGHLELLPSQKSFWGKTFHIHENMNSLGPSHSIPSVRWALPSR